jgi:chaperonin GroES
VIVRAIFSVEFFYFDLALATQLASAALATRERQPHLSAFGQLSRKDNMSFRPLHDRVVLRRLEGEEKTKGGIIIPDTAKEKPQEAEVVAVGPGARDEQGKLRPIDLKVGDRVLFGKWSGTEVKIGGEDLLIAKESDVLGVVA